MELQDVIRIRRKELNLSLEQIAQACGVGKSIVSKWERGDIKNIRRDNLAALADVLQVSPLVLLGREEIQPNQYDNIPNLVPLAPMQRIPLVGTIACGTPILAQENIEGYVDLPKHIKADFALTCEGDSMIDAGIKDGDVVYIRSQPEVQNGQIAAVLVDGESATLKRFFFNDGVVTLMAANQTYPPIVKAGSDVEQVRVLGLAVGLSRSFFK